MSTIRSLCTINRELISLLTLCSAMLIGCAGSDDGPGNSDPKCQINTPSEKSPGYPYKLDKFKSDVLPVLTATCTGAGCHSAPTGQGSFTVWTATEGCDFNQTFNSTIAKIDLTAPNNSKLIAVVTGGDPAHPKTFNANVAGDKASLDKLTAFITDAKTTQDAGGGGTDTAGPGPSPFDYTVFKTQVQPAIS